MKSMEWFWCVLLAGLTALGCGGPPQVSPVNRRLIDGLRTAASSRQLQWIEESAKQVEEGKRGGAVSEREYEEFSSIIRLAREGQWQQAEAQSMRLAKAQKPTAQEIEQSTAPRKLD